MRNAGKICVALLLFALCSCSTTKVLQDGEYRLASNKISVNDKDFRSAQLDPYVQQKTSGWSPFLCVYNWANGKGKGWDKFVKRIGQAPVVYEADMVGKSEENIERRLEYLGYFDSKVNADVKVRKRKVYVMYNVELGHRYPIRNFTWDVPSGRFEEDFNRDSASISIRPGMMLSEQAVEAESERSAAAMRNMGYYGFSAENFFFEADTAGLDGMVDLHMSIREYTRGGSPKDARPLMPSQFDKVTISHPAGLKFRESVLRNLNTIRPGETYSEEQANICYSRLGALRVFNNVNIDMVPSAEDKVDCNISLSKSKLQGFKVNLEGSVNSTGLFGISPQVSYYNKNIFHGGEWLNLSFMGNFQFRLKDNIHSNELGCSAGLSFPKFLGLPYRIFKGANVPRTDITLSYNYQNRPEYTRNMISASYGYNASQGKFYYQIYPLSLNIIHLDQLDKDFENSLASDPFMRNSYSDHFDFGSSGNFYYSTSTESNPQSSFFYTRLQINHAGNLLCAFNKLMKQDEDGKRIIWETPYSQYVRAELTLGNTWRFGRNDGQVLAARLIAGAGYAYGNSSALPFERRFYGGGANSLRGWQSRTVGPGMSQLDTTFVIPNQSGDIHLEANLEYRFKIVWKLEGAAFVDAGNVWNYRSPEAVDELSVLSGKNFFKSVAMDWGVGLRLNLNFIVLRVDWGMRLHDPSREQRWLNPRDWVRRNGYAVHFGVGYPF